MPRDPLDNVMKRIQGDLRSHGAVDPNRAAHREAQMKQERQRLGAQPGRTPRGQPPPGRQPAPGTQEVGGAGLEMAEGDLDDYTITQIDQLNEAIITGKVKLHHAQTEEERKREEETLQALRQQILDMGGEPIWAEETIQEGVQKLRGHGYAGAHRTQQFIDEDLHGPHYGDPHDVQRGEGPRQRGGQTGRQTPTQHGVPERYVREGDIPEDEPGPGIVDPTRPGPDEPSPDRRYAHPGRREEPDPDVGYETRQRGAVVDDEEDVTDWGRSVDEVEDYRRAEETEVPVAEPDDELSAALLEAGIDAERDMEAPVAPWEREDYGHVEFDEPYLDEESFNEIMFNEGLEPMSEEEIRESAAAMVERMRLSKTQMVQRELDKFNREFPNEFEKAKERLREGAAEYKAEQREEFTGRGLLYSSVMANVSDATDEAVIEQINEISMAAANRVMELEDEIRDINQWAIVEEEALFREMQVEERTHARELARIQSAAAIQFSQMQLDRQYKEVSAAQNQMRIQLEQYDREFDRYVQEEQWAGVAQLASAPGIAGTLSEMGMSAERVEQMSPAALANTVGAAIDWMTTNSEIQANRARAMASRANATLANTQANLAHASHHMEKELHNLRVRKTNLELDAMEQSLAMPDEWDVVARNIYGQVGMPAMDNMDYYLTEVERGADLHAEDDEGMSLADQMRRNLQPLRRTYEAIPPGDPHTEALGEYIRNVETVLEEGAVSEEDAGWLRDGLDWLNRVLGGSARLGGFGVGGERPIGTGLAPLGHTSPGEDVPVEGE